MPSPFPGMDPWLEAAHVFPNFHDRFLVYLCDEMNASLPKGYVATINNRIYADEASHGEPDVSVVGRSSKSESEPAWGIEAYAQTGATTIAAGPRTDPTRERFLEILASDGKRLVTAVEMLSRANKRPGAKQRGAYRRKQRKLLESSVNLVELDFLRTGKPTTLFPEDDKPPRTVDDYHASVLTFNNGSWYSFLPIPLRKPLPTLPVPLEPSMKPLFIPMQPIFERCYKGGRYEELVDYDEPCRPLLTPEHEAWANVILAACGGST